MGEIKTPQQLNAAYKNNQVIPEWPIPDAFKDAKEVTYRNRMGEHLLEMPADKIVKYYAYHSFEEMELWLAIFKKHTTLKGIGLELGAGCGVMATVFAKEPQVQMILGVEVVDSMTHQIMPKVANGYLGAESHKMVPVLGTFDNLQIPDNSIDFIVEMDSIHHSHNLKQTFAESFRVLKKGGVMIFLDRCHPDFVTDEKVKELLDVVYTPEWIEHNFYPSGSILTRRENGEHEYRKKEWLTAIQGAGFKVERLTKCYKKASIKSALSNVLGFIRDSILGKRFNANGAKLKEAKIWFTQQTGIVTFVKDEFEVNPQPDPINHCLFVLKKP
jgi:ubiquinone/menaquinone biosynthesis C-methylase UbiE